MSDISTNPKYPIYIPSKGRADSRLTIKGLNAIGVPYRVIIEEQEYAEYAAVVDRNRLLVLDKQYQRDYDPCDDLGFERSKGSGPARNFAWEHSIAEGHSWHWVMDDNIREFHRLHNNRIIRAGDGTVLYCMEEFVNRYANVAMAGPMYRMFCPRRDKRSPFCLNTRIYSCNLIRNDIPFRWRARYNEDTDLSLRILKSGLCTIQFSAFLQEKMQTQRLRGGNTDEIYKNGTVEKSKMIARLHPDVCKVAWKYGRCHHQINYRPFQATRLIRRPGLEIPKEPNNFGMEVKNIAQESVGGV